VTTPRAEDGNGCVTIVAPRQVAYRTGSVPAPGPGQVLVRTHYSGISAGTEMNVYRGVAPQWRTRQETASGLFHGEPEWSYPLVYGYANVGAVAALGEGVDRLSEGDLVFSYTPHCDWVVAAADAVLPLPSIPDPRRGVFFANLNTALNGVLDARPCLGETVVVSGLGVIGLIVTRLLRRAGAGLVVGIDPLDLRRGLALEAGAHLALSPEEPVAERVRELTGGRGADTVIEVSGSSAALNEAIRLVGFGGLVLAMSWYGGTFESLSLAGEFHHNRVRIRSSQVGSVNPDLGPLWSTERRSALAGDLLAEFPLERYITHEFHPSGAGEAYELLDRLGPDALQCVFRFVEG
jgi:2-desacetyl-2-hydroxyethyl bacteriochlorophyllide A dehydrogenase